MREVSPYASTNGGWPMHKEGVMGDKTKIPIKCKCCQKKFTATATKNTDYAELLIFEKYCRFICDGDYGSSYTLWVTPAKQWQSVCPNCKVYEILFVEATEDDKEEHYNDEMYYRLRNMVKSSELMYNMGIGIFFFIFIVMLIMVWVFA